ncbi:hypothetical protein FHS59_000057 [Algoriphagus iocasae]|uniref:Uncharacterized protein n=1 Tax=Algoriphagus iocasae TaxID=1836499 RepID=A0A841M958_9BACT|nr:DUF4221 family protein [Algoriphagus iocasae]MBB6324442.1 hypothetical protein [Algoriphagus iocasae]
MLLEDFSLIKDNQTTGFSNLKSIEKDGEEWIVYLSGATKFNGRAINFADTKSGEKIDQIQIPSDGPNSLKGAWFSYIVSPSKIIGISDLGEIGVYDSIGNKISHVKSSLRESNNMMADAHVQPENGLMQFKPPYLQIGQNPTYWVNLGPNTKPGEMRTAFPLDFKSWLSQINIETGEVVSSEFFIPGGYDQFEGDMTATQLFGDRDKTRGHYLLGWPYSDTIYVLKDLEIVKKIAPTSKQKFKYMPNEIIPWGNQFTVWALPKEASKHLFLLYDEKRDLIIRCSKIKESGTGDTKFERTKHYILSVFSGDWEPKGEYLFDFQTEVEVENWFLTSEGLFINKPEQKSEDEYEFYKIDLSRFEK